MAVKKSKKAKRSPPPNPKLDSSTHGGGKERKASGAATSAEAGLVAALVEAHGSLTQLNELYPPGQRLEATDTQQEAEARLGSLPPGPLAAYARLAERGVAAADRMFASVVVSVATRYCAERARVSAGGSGRPISTDSRSGSV